MESLASGDLCQAPPSHQVFTGAEEGIASKTFQPCRSLSTDATCPSSNANLVTAFCLPLSLGSSLWVYRQSSQLDLSSTFLPPCSVTLFLSGPAGPSLMSVCEAFLFSTHRLNLSRVHVLRDGSSDSLCIPLVLPPLLPPSRHG